MRFLLPAALAVTVLSAPHARASGFLTGNALLEKCEAEKGSFPWVECRGYVTGSADQLGLKDAAYQEHHFCLPSGTAGGQIVTIVRDYLHRHPEELHWGANMLVFNSLMEKYSCPDKAAG